MIFCFVFIFERSMQIPIKIPTGSIQDKEIEYFTFSYLQKEIKQMIPLRKSEWILHTSLLKRP
jgi:hypothetical protein